MSDPKVIGILPANVTRERHRLDQAVQLIKETIEYGAKLHGISLPERFAEERARNCVVAIMPLFEEAQASGYDEALAIEAAKRDARNSG